MRARRAVRTALPIVAALVWLGTSASAGSATAAGVREVDVVAHAGGLAAAPQNTAAAVRLSVSQGADVVENDFQRTADGRIVVLHDTSLANTTNVEEVFPTRAPWNVGDFTLAEIRQLDAGSWFSPAFQGERIPTLRQWARAVGDEAAMLIEAKTPELYPGIASQLATEVRSRPVLQRALRDGRLVVMSFNQIWVQRFHRVAPEVPVGIVYGYRPTPEELRLASTWVSDIVPALSVVDPETLRIARLLGLRIDIWTVNTPEELRRAVDWGADAVITDVPRFIDRTLRQWGG